MTRAQQGGDVGDLRGPVSGKVPVEIWPWKQSVSRCMGTLGDFNPCLLRGHEYLHTNRSGRPADGQRVPKVPTHRNSPHQQQVMERQAVWTWSGTSAASRRDPN
jgi:hypothetical protein